MIPTERNVGSTDYNKYITLNYPSMFGVLRVVRVIRNLKVDWKTLEEPMLPGKAHKSLGTLF